MSFVVGGWAFLARPQAARWMGREDGRMGFGRTCVRNDELNLQFHRVGCHPWLPERRNGPARRIYNRLFGDDRFF